MVFSFFKKPPQKMPERPVARPKAPTPEPAAPAEPEVGQVQVPAAEDSAPPPPKELPPLEFSESGLDFTDSGISGIQVDHDVDPIQADIEQAAVLFANGQDSAARAVLEATARAHAGALGERLWRMLLDLTQVLNDRAAFDLLVEEFTQTCETSPPTWRPLESPGAAKQAASGEMAITLQGVIAGADGPELQALRVAVAGKQPVRVDLGKLASCDDAAAEVLLEMLKQSRKIGLALTVEGAEGMVGRLSRRLVVGQQEALGSWHLLLELLLRQGNQDAFEEKAVDYAVTFEVSPPSWEAIKAPAAAAKKAATPPVPVDDAFYLSGELKNCRFEDVRGFVEKQARPILDFTAVKRMDFFSAGLLRNILDRCPAQGKEVVIRNPHHLVAELMGIVDLPSVAKIIVRKY